MAFLIPDDADDVDIKHASQMADMEEPSPTCIGCNKSPSEIEEYVEIAKLEGMEPDQYVREEEGTFNPANGHFACTDCYIEIGMPSLPYPRRWRAP